MERTIGLPSGAPSPKRHPRRRFSLAVVLAEMISRAARTHSETTMTDAASRPSAFASSDPDDLARVRDSSARRPSGGGRIPIRFIGASGARA